MDVFHTSDTHFGHARILELCNRPFRDVTEMGETIVENWNSVVPPTGRVYHHGDVALGPIMESLKWVSKLNGEIVLIDGNHDRRFMAKNDAQRAKWEQIYLDAGFSAIYPNLSLVNFASLPVPAVNLSHFPYEGDSHDGDRFESRRLEDNGVPLLHGHTHSSGPAVSWSSKRTKRVPVLDENGDPKFDRKNKPITEEVPDPTLQIHVGMDAWNFTPVSHREISEILVENGLQTV
jgi:calcineurin-like phosphoesterase family protein